MGKVLMVTKKFNKVYKASFIEFYSLEQTFKYHIAITKCFYLYYSIRFHCFTSCILCF